MADLSVTGEVVVTSEKAEAAFDRVGDKATQMANEVASSAGKAGQAVDGIGAGAEKSADKFTRAESRMRDAIKRSTQELQLLGKTASEKLEFNINAKGLDASKFAPYIEELKKAEQAQRLATGGLDKMGISAAQTAAALRGVPAQFTDIITSLQGGQAPLTVFLQQGGQLKDMFGGAGAAARALGGYVAGLINPFTLAAAGAAALAVAYNQGSKEADAYRTALVTTGNAAGTTSGQLKSYAQEISGLVGTQGKAAESLAAFVSTGRVSRDVLKEASQAAIAWERATGQAVGATAKQFADLGKDPLQAVLKLNEGTNFLTESAYKQIKSLEEQGKTAEAAAVAQRAYADALTGRSATITQNLGYIEKAWQGITGAAKKGWDAMLNVGRASTPADATSELRARLNRQQEELAAKRAINPYADTSGMEKGIEILKQRIGLLESDERQTRRNAEAEAARAAQNAAAVEWDKEGAKYLSEKAKLERDLTKARNEGLAAGKTQAEIEQRLAQIRDSYAKKGGSSAASENKELRERQRIYAELAGVSSTYYNDLAAAQSERAKGNLSEAEYVKYVETLIQKQPFAVAQEKDRAEAIKESAKAAAKSSKALSAWYEVREKESQGLQNQINARREEVSMMGMTTEAVIEYTRAKFEQQAAEKEAYAAALESASFYAGEYADAYKTAAEAARQQAAQLRELGGLEVEKVNKDAAKKAAQEWERAAADIERALTDSLMRGFESGKDFAKNLRDTVVNMFNTMVLRPVISAVVNPIAGAVTGALGLSSAASAATGGSAIGAIGTGASIYNAGTGLAGMAGGFANGLSAWGSGGSVTGVLSNPGLYTGAELMGAVAPFIAGAALLGNVFGLFRKTEKRGYGLMGTLGEEDGIHDLDLMRKGGSLVSGPKWFVRDTGVSEMDKALQETYKQQRDALMKMGEALGLATDHVKDFTVTLGSDELGDNKVRGIRLDGLSDEEALKKIAEAMATASNEIAQQIIGTWERTVRESVVDERYIPSEFARDGEQAIDTLTRLATSITGVNTAFENLGYTLYEASLAGGDMASQLVDLFGGLEQFSQSTGVYMQNFYSAEEQRDVVRRQLERAFEGLDLKLPDIDASDAREQFRAIAEAQDLTTESGRETWAALMNLSGAFASVTQSSDDAAAKQASIRADLERQVLELTGDTAAIRQLEIAGMNAANVALYDRVQALQAEAEQAALRADLERQVLELTGDTAALRLLEIAGMDAANVALYDRVQALQTAQAAEQAQAQREVDAFVSLYGDVAAALAEINPPAQTLVDTFRSTRDELENLTNGLDQALGNLPEPTTLEQLRASMEALRGIAQASSDLNEQIFGIKVGRGDQAAVELLKSREASLFADLQTSADPAGVAKQLSQTMLQRIALEGKLEEQAINERYQREFEAATTLADLESKNRSAQMDALREQISGAGRLSEIAKSMQGFVADLKFGDLSALNSADQLAAAQGEYERILMAAKSGDVNAAAQLQSASTSFLREQQGYSGGATGDYASTFAQVVADLDAFGAMPVSDIALLQDQLASLDALERASATLQTAVIDTSQRQIDAIGSVNVALLSRRDDINARADEQKAILTKQVEALNALVEDQKAQITQAAATHQALMERLDEMSENLERLTSNSNQQAAQPA